ncbi:unnamed protein product [Clavelina lepadiformis]|uniref:asparagine--tRNA ligase n=1 Tax=Clavelina lepadiformis TaxID=159417 RepID=A0ABP0EWG5_CLALP
MKTIKISQAKSSQDIRVRISGWLHRVVKPEKNLVTVIIRDGTGYLQAILNDKKCQANNNIQLTPESTITLCGVITKVPEERSVPGGLEFVCDYWKLIGSAPAGGIEAVIKQGASVDTLLDNRHLVVRNEETSKILKVQSHVLHAIRNHFFERDCHEVTPPCLVQFDFECCGSAFDINYFGKQVYLSPSNEPYLEMCLPALGNVFCISKSYRAEQRITRRHLAEFTHVQTQYGFITFNDLLDYMEDFICDVVDKVMKSTAGQFIKDLNPDFKFPKRPFRRMDYTEAIAYLKEHGITKQDGSYYELGEDISEEPERKMIDKINEPLLLCRFPAKTVPFYIPTCPENREYTESVDLLMPNVGEIAGGSTKLDNYEELLEAYKKCDIDPCVYYWYSDLRKYGTCPHGGYGLGLERLLTWLCNQHNIRDVCLCPRFIDRCSP